AKELYAAEIVIELQHNNIEDMQSNGTRIGEWAGWKSKPKVISISTPRVALKLLTEVFKEHPDDELRS
ncbi:21344_t:CDS:2, partial [Gigaspora rosea]